MPFGRGARALLLAAALVVVLSGIRYAAPLLGPILLALFIATASTPIIEWLTKRGVSAVAAVMVALLIDVAFLFGAGLLVGFSLNELYLQLPHYQERFGQIEHDIAHWMAAHGWQGSTDNLTESMMGESALATAAETLKVVLAMLSDLVLVLLILIFLLLEATGIRRKLERILAEPEKDLERFGTATREIQKYLLVKTTLSIVTGIAAGTIAAIFGVDFPLLWGMLAFVLNYIPSIGGVLATIAPTALALLQHGVGTAAAVATANFVVHFTIGNVIEPRVMGRALGLSELVVLLSMIFWGWLLGPIGAVLSVPLTMIIKIILLNTDGYAWIGVLLGPSRQRREDERPVKVRVSLVDRPSRSEISAPPTYP